MREGLRRLKGQSFYLGDDIRIEIMHVCPSGRRVELLVEHPEELELRRGEVVVMKAQPKGD